MKKTLLAVVFGFLFIPLTSYAVCTQSGHIVRVTAWADGVSTVHTIYMKTFSLSSIYYRVTTTDDNMAEIAVTNQASSARVTVQGNAPTCPTTGTGRSMGALRYIVTNP